ncbi:uncharacterized protein L969DRAFT_93163 [Mixia osmundae IAM 14324]|uniref:Sugar phosphate transporter domain-containing protein n=1 Tax=Mixia osmundae (strain CBS 9802 / IAM 14324 / JCM 22182 / KY 12970) TaxID=764103 RepID=G7E5W9_MIXOS|nr:uncharacterized protein L969DRAFT_93163 [Mixia osmundae IAM 14324]KEI40619.1 hypothetical protein L969DRAFT_93163 [Mixia osmundae IAM 14324]GAA98229.1 hypothetical protein E5Q_04912 [Mixia osmundae IAM 14324]
MSHGSTTLVPVLVVGMLVTGCANSLLTKLQDNICVADCDSVHPKLFEQPTWQSANMFAGEILCLLAFSILTSLGTSRRGVALGESAHLSSDEPGPTDPMLIKSPSSAPVGGHGAAVTPIAASLDASSQADLADGKLLTGPRRFLFALPALCDILGTTLMNVGLFLTPVSIYQMLRGALVLWVGLFSYLFLGRNLTKSQVASLFVVMLGVAIVGLSNALSGKGAIEDAEAGKSLVGVFIILFAQVFTASQFVIEEKVMTVYVVPPLFAVGLEGFFGLIMTLILMLVLWAAIGRQPSHQGGYFDLPAGWHQIVADPQILGLCIAIMFSIALFNWTGLSVTRRLSATARSLIDTSRTVGIWAVSVLVGWEEVRLLQIVGFVFIVYGTIVYNGITSFPSFLRLGPTLPEETNPYDPVGREED